MTASPSTKDILRRHLRAYPLAKIQDVLKLIHQSSFGCEHMVRSPDDAAHRIREELATINTGAPRPAHPIEPLDGPYSRVHLSYLESGLSADTLGRLFYLSAKQTPPHATVEDKLSACEAMIETGELALDAAEWRRAVDTWREDGYPALHHSDAFRSAYHPAYRVIANTYLPYLPLLAAIDRTLTERHRLTLAIEGGSASGKSTLGALLASLYDCTVFHMDDFFLRPEQRTTTRLAEVGGNVDRERVLHDILSPLRQGLDVTYRPFDCSTMSLRPPVTVTPTPLTVIEGAYCMHPELAPYYDLSVFLDISSDLQKKRIRNRNTPNMAERFFHEWIPMEKRYFEGMRVKERCELTIDVQE